MKGEIISCSAHKDIYFLETNTQSASTDLANLFASPAGRELMKYKPQTKLKHKFNPALEFFSQSKSATTFKTASTTTDQQNQQTNSIATTNATESNTPAKTSRSESRRTSIDLYEEAASILGLTCSQTNSCRCLECQCHYFDFEEEMDSSNGNDFLVDHTASCCIQ